MEGYLPAEWCIVWFAVALPCVLMGARKIICLTRENPENKMPIALSGAFIFLLSSLKLPSVTGSSSHPTGTGLSVVLYGISVTSFLATLVLIFQAVLLAHGGLTTLGANIVSMGIAGPAVGFAVWYTLRKGGLKVAPAMFATAFAANICTYTVTAIQLALAHGAADYLGAFIKFMSVFAVTQIPIAVIEGIIFAIFADYIARARPDIFSFSPEDTIRKGCTDNES